MESSIKDKYIILGFVGFAIVLISSIATLVIADSFNQDNFVKIGRASCRERVCLYV